MKTIAITYRLYVSLACMVAGFFFFQSCTKTEEVMPAATPAYIVSVKIRDIHNVESATMEGEQFKHLRITTTSPAQKTVLDTTIASDFTFSFKSQAQDLNIKVALSSASFFNNSIEIDANGQMQAYHSGSCAGTEYDLTDEISF